MCLVGISISDDRLVIAANRDEVFSRPAAPLDWWGEPPILAGRDLKGGGTWLGVTSSRIGLVTNVREQVPVAPDAPSRGEIVRYWLGGASLDALEGHVVDSGFAGVNVLAFDLARGEYAHFSNRGRARTMLSAGIHGLSNATIDTPWPKVVALDAAVSHASSSDELFAALADDRLAVDGLPSTGVPPEIERRLSAAFIRMPDLGYGTRCSSVIMLSGDDLSFTERTFDQNGVAIGDRHFSLKAERPRPPTPSS